VTLFFVMCGHSILEMAPDALFLRSLPVAQLHWVLIIATLTVFGTTFLRPVAFPASTPDEMSVFARGPGSGALPRAPESTAGQRPVEPVRAPVRSGAAGARAAGSRTPVCVPKAGTIRTWVCSLAKTSCAHWRRWRASFQQGGAPS
jgi:hypothetical protein